MKDKYREYAQAYGQATDAYIDGEISREQLFEALSTIRHTATRSDEWRLSRPRRRASGR